MTTTTIASPKHLDDSIRGVKFRGHRREKIDGSTAAHWRGANNESGPALAALRVKTPKSPWRPGATEAWIFAGEVLRRLAMAEASLRDQETQALERFGLTEFRPGQREIIDAILAGIPTLAVMPTGAGKSLCYQLPAVLLPGLTVVVSPLISLMKDQVDALTRRGIAAADITSAVSEGERWRRLEQAATGEIKLLYVAPERFRSPRFSAALSRLKLALLAIDEAHCISQWGHDFRPDYLRLGDVVATYSPERIVALTATATADVRHDIQAQLGFKNPRVFVRGFDRPNLCFSVANVTLADKASEVARLAPPGTSSIAYVATRKNAANLGGELLRLGRKAAVYHAGLDERARQNVQDDFMGGKVDILVATNAFGMGVDKPDVRSVIHVDIPGSVEDYYQEAGRAGRDSKPAECTLLFNHGDVRIQEFFIDNSYPSAATLRNVWRALWDTPEVGRDEASLAERAQVPTSMQTRTAVRLLLEAGLLSERDGVLAAVKPNEDQPRFDPESPSRRAEFDRARLKRIVAYAYLGTCRRRALLSYFGDEARAQMAGGCGNCDNCLTRVRRQPNRAEQALIHALLQAVHKTGGRLGRHRIWQSVVEEGGDLDKDRAFKLFDLLEEAGLIETARGEYPTVDLTLLGERALRDPAAMPDLPFAAINAPKRAAKKRKRRQYA